jgi:Xaa-Pro aminopeptidase
VHAIERKIETIFGYFAENPPQGLLIFNRERVDKNFVYLTELENGVFENCGVFVEKNGKVTIFTSALEEEAARAAERWFEIAVFKNEQERVEKLKGVLSPCRSIGVCFGALSHSFYLFLAQTLPHVSWIDASGALKRARMIKTREEIEKIRKACDIASRVADGIPAMLREGMTELELSAEIDYRLRKEGARSPAFRTIAAFSKNTSMPHYGGGEVRLSNGDVVLVDFGAEYRGYSSDITQTYITGSPDHRLVDLYAAVYKAEGRAIDMIGEGVSVDEVDREIRALFDAREEYRGRFIHGLGHSLGLDVHDDSYPSEDFNKRFAENMVLTVEPGIYLPGLYGVRLEDDVLVTKNGCRVLTSAKKDFKAYEIH